MVWPFLGPDQSLFLGASTQEVSVELQIIPLEMMERHKGPRSSSATNSSLFGFGCRPCEGYWIPSTPLGNYHLISTASLKVEKV